MKDQMQLTNRTQLVRNLVNRSPWRRGVFRIPLTLALACLALSPTARAVYPPPDGAYFPENTAEGEDALFSNTTGFANTAIGREALYYNTTGFFNTATGGNTLVSNTTGARNTAAGEYTLILNTTGSDNTGTGESTLASNTTGNSNTATGAIALLNNTTGSNNTAEGYNALENNTIGGSNIALGESAGINLTTGSNNIDIGNKGVAGESKTIRLGKKGTQTATFIAGISGTTVAGGVGVLIDTNGRLGTVVSSARFKDAIKPMDEASEAILALQPVTFHYKHELDPNGIPQFGLVAEQVEKVDPDLVARDENGKPFTVRYEAVNAMLLNEFLKAHRKVETLETTVVQERKEFQSAIAQLQSLVKIQTVQLQEVLAQVQASKPVPGRATSTERGRAPSPSERNPARRGDFDSLR
jgi:hypothetical protein